MSSQLEVLNLPRLKKSPIIHLPCWGVYTSVLDGICCQTSPLDKVKVCRSAYWKGSFHTSSASTNSQKSEFLSSLSQLVHSGILRCWKNVHYFDISALHLNWLFGKLQFEKWDLNGTKRCSLNDSRVQGQWCGGNVPSDKRWKANNLFLSVSAGTKSLLTGGRTEEKCMQSQKRF